MAQKLIGPHRAGPQALNIFGAFAVAAAENMLTARGVDLRRVQKLFTGLGAGFEFVFLTVFALAKRPATATAAYYMVMVGHLLHGGAGLCRRRAGTTCNSPG